MYRETLQEYVARIKSNKAEHIYGSMKNWLKELTPELIEDTEKFMQWNGKICRWLPALTADHDYRTLNLVYRHLRAQRLLQTRVAELNQAQREARGAIRTLLFLVEECMDQTLPLVEMAGRPVGILQLLDYLHEHDRMQAPEIELDSLVDHFKVGDEAITEWGYQLITLGLVHWDLHWLRITPRGEAMALALKRFAPEHKPSTVPA
jgi:hypothetical protein